MPPKPPTLALTHKTQQEILGIIRETGADGRTAAARVGVSPSQYQAWLKRTDPVYVAFQEAVRRVEAEWEHDRLQVIRAIGEPTGREVRTRRTVTTKTYDVVDPRTGEVNRNTVTTQVETFVGYEGDWRAAAWLLERRLPARYARREALEVSGPDGGPVEHEDAGARRERLEGMLAEIAHREAREAEHTDG